MGWLGNNREVFMSLKDVSRGAAPSFLGTTFGGKQCQMPGVFEA